jgi:hypothetical protein
LPTAAAEPTFMGMPDTYGNRYEVVYGELLVTPVPRL